jgi:hypothetical protein
VEPLEFGIERYHLAVIPACGKRVLGIERLVGRDREGKLEHAVGAPGVDDPLDGLGGIGPAGEIPAINGAEQATSDRVAPKRASEVDDDLVVGSTVLAWRRGSAVDEDAAGTRIEDAVRDLTCAGRSAPADGPVREPAAEKEAPTQHQIADRRACEERH